MSKLHLVLSITMLVSIASCMDREADVAETHEVQSDLVVADPCGDQLAADNNACTADYNACMSQAQGKWDKVACAVSRAACMAAAAAKYVLCVKNQGVPTQTLPAGTTSLLDGVVPRMTPAREPLFDCPS